MILVKPAALPVKDWCVVYPESIEDVRVDGAHLVALEGDKIDELIVFLKAVKPRRIIVATKDEMFFRSIASAFTPDKVLRLDTV